MDSFWAGRIGSQILAAGGLLLVLSVAAFPQDNPKALVSEMVHNELNTQHTPHYWMYLQLPWSRIRTTTRCAPARLVHTAS